MAAHPLYPPCFRATTIVDAGEPPRLAALEPGVVEPLDALARRVAEPAGVSMSAF